jgi:hypothetical protein
MRSVLLVVSGIAVGFAICFALFGGIQVPAQHRAFVHQAAAQQHISASAFVGQVLAGEREWLQQQ